MQRRGIEPAAVIADLKRDAIRLHAQAYGHAMGLRVADNVVQGFLHDAIERFLHIERYVWLVTQIDLEHQPMPCTQQVDLS